MNCGRCGSDQTQRFALVYRAGAQQIRTSSHSAPYYSMASVMGVGGVVTETSGIASSLLAETTAPPEESSYALAALLLLSAAALVAIGRHWDQDVLIVGGAILFALGLYSALRSYRYNTRIWPDLYRDWQRRWICLRCGNTFYVP
jgi:hypothetical protein